MHNRLVALTALAATALFSGGCIGPFARDEPAAPPPLQAAPTPQVTQTELPPPPATDVAALPPTDPAAGAELRGTTPGMPASPAAPDPAAGAVDVGRTDLLGGWTLASGGSSCQLFMSLTTWSGGYRATTRGCSAEPMQKISAWNLEGRQVLLLNDTGATVARLYPSSKTQFNGLSQGGGPVTVSR